MIRNLQIEWMKIKNYRVFQVFSVLYLAGILIIIYIFYKIYMQLMGRVMSMANPNSRDERDLFQLFSEDAIWNTVCFATSFLLYLPGMVIINLFINEVNFKTHRQNIIDGWKRETFIYTKIGLIFCMSLVITVMNLIAIMIMCRVTDTHFSLSGMDTLALSFLQTFVYLMFALLLATFFRRSGVAIIVFFIYGLLLEFIFMWLFSKIDPALAHFLPLQVADSLITFANIDEGIFRGRPGTSVMVPAALAFAGLYIYLTVRKYKYDDL